MPFKVQRAVLWRIDTSNTPGALAAALAPLAAGRVNLGLVMGYSHPDKRSATIEVAPIATAAAQKAARAAGLTKSAFPCVSVTGRDTPGISHAIASALSQAGINLNFFIAQSIGNTYTGMFSFEAQADADLAVGIIKSALNRRPVSKSESRPTRKSPTRARKSRAPSFAASGAQ